MTNLSLSPTAGADRKTTTSIPLPATLLPSVMIDADAQRPIPAAFKAVVVDPPPVLSSGDEEAKAEITRRFLAPELPPMRFA